MKKEDVDRLFDGIRSIWNTGGSAFHILKASIDEGHKAPSSHIDLFLGAGLIEHNGTFKSGLKAVFLASLESVSDDESNDFGSDRLLQHTLAYPVQLSLYDKK